MPPVSRACDGPAEPERVERLDQPALGARAPGQEDVGPAVEEHQHRDVVESAVGLLEPQLEADRHAAHVAHLQVHDDQVGPVWRATSSRTAGPEATSTTSVSGPSTAAGSPSRTEGRVAGHQTCARSRLPDGGAGVPDGPNRLSATRPSPSRSWTSLPSSGTRPTGAGGHPADQARRRRASSRSATASSWRRFSTRAARASLPLRRRRRGREVRRPEGGVHPVHHQACRPGSRSRPAARRRTPPPPPRRAGAR